MDDLTYCIEYLRQKSGEKRNFGVSPEDDLRALMNISMPVDFSDEFFSRQDAVLQEVLRRKKVVDVTALSEVTPGISLYKGDITLLQADAIVNAANGRMLGCLAPLHACIDNAIHSFAGLQVRRDLMKVMAEQGGDEPPGKVKVTKGYNLPSKFIFHTVGPIVSGSPTPRDAILLRSCYLSCLQKAAEMGLKSLVFCSISTGVYGYPIEKATKVAVQTVKDFLHKGSDMRVIFDVFSDRDFSVYRAELT